MGYINTKAEIFIKKYEYKDVLCFGSGSYFMIMLEDFYQKKSKVSIAGVIDNNPLKHGTRVKFRHMEIPVYSYEEVARMYSLRETPILITTASHNEVMNQIQQMDHFDQMSVYSYFDLKLKSTPVYNEVDQGESESVIPKIIHYCWFGGKEIPNYLQKCIDSWKRHCPEYEVIQWNESNYDVTKNFFLKTAWERKKWGFVPDYARLDIIHQNGGIYLDTDVELVNSLELLTYNNAFFCTEVSGGINEGSGFGAIKGNPLIKELMEIYENIEEDSPYLFNTSLGKEIGIFHKNGYENSGKFQKMDLAVIYPFHVMAPKIKETGRQYTTEATIGVHHFDGSWCR